jgi:hypothetical protein
LCRVTTFVDYTDSSVLDELGIRVTALCGRRVRWKAVSRVFSCLVGYGGTADYIVHDNNEINVLRAVVERVLRVKSKSLENYGELVGTPTSDNGEWGGIILRIRNKLITRSHTPRVIPREEYAGYYTGRRRRVYQRAYDNLPRALSRENFPYFGRVEAFMKVEKVQRTPSKPDPVPRLIQPRRAVYNLALGCFLKPCEIIMKQAFKDVYGYDVIFKGMDPSTSGEKLRAIWEKFDRPVAISTDASRFDQHVTQAALQWEHEYYKQIYGKSIGRKDRTLLDKLLKMQLFNECSATVDKSKIKYQTEGKRCSGDINTSMGNILLMATMLLAHLEELGLHSKFTGPKTTAAYVVNNGDDAIIITEATNLALVVEGLCERFLRWGFTMAVEEPVYIFECIEFCQTQPVLTTTGYRMTRNPYTALAKDMMRSIPFVDDADIKNWLAVVGEGGLSQTRGLPVWESFYTSLVDSCKFTGTKKQRLAYLRDYNESGFARCRAGTKGGVITPQVRFSFWLAFGLCPEDQLDVEKQGVFRVIHAHHANISTQIANKLLAPINIRQNYTNKAINQPIWLKEKINQIERNRLEKLQGSR